MTKRAFELAVMHRVAKEKKKEYLNVYKFLRELLGILAVLIYNKNLIKSFRVFLFVSLIFDDIQFSSNTRSSSCLIIK